MHLHKNIRLLTWFNFFLDFRFYAPVAILYFAHVSGSFAAGMSIFSVTMLSAAIFEIPTGVFSDTIGRKKTLVIGAATTVVSVIFYALGISYWSLVVGAIFEGFARSLYSGNNNSLLHDTLSEKKQEKEYAHFLGRTSYTAQVALAITALTGGVIAYFSYAWVMWLSVIPVIIGLLISTQVVEPRISSSKEAGNAYAHLKEALGYFKTNKKLRMLSIASILGFAQGESSYQFRSAFVATLWPIWAIGIAKFVSNIGAAISFYVSGKIIKRFGGFKTIITGKIYALISDVVAVVFPTGLSPIILSSNSFFFGTSVVSGNTLRQKEFTDSERATMESLISLGRSVMFAAVAFAMGVVADIIGPAGAYLSVKLLAVVSLFIYIRLYKSHKK